MAYKLSDLTILNKVFDKLFKSVGITEGTFPDFVTQQSGPLVIDQPTTLYVSSTGNDNNTGGVNDPFLTIQAAVNSLYDIRLNGLVTIQVATGTYDGFYVGGLSVWPSSQTIGGPTGLQIQGTMITATLAQGSATGTATGGSSGVMNDSGANWAVNALAGKILSLNGSQFIIQSNTATSITFIQSNTPTNGQPYIIQDWGTSISGNARGAGSLTGSSTTSNLACIFVEANRNNPGNNNIGVRWLKMDMGSGLTGISVGPGASVFPSFCWFTNGANFATCLSLRSWALPSLMSSCVLDVPNSGTGIQVNVDCDIGGMSMLFIRSTAGSPNGTGIMGLNGLVLMQGLRFQNLSTAISIDNPSAPSVGIGSAKLMGTTNFGGFSFTSCTTCVSMAGGFITFGTNAVTCSGNTNGFVLSRGAKAQVGSGINIGATNEIILDGAAAQTLATMRAASPKLLTNTYGTIIYE